jgi:GNAT superfamily N-acetyltransferase
MEDVDAIAGLSGQLGYPVTGPDTGRRLGSILDRSDHAVFIATGAAGEPVGWIHVGATHRLEAGPFAEIGGLVVDAANRGGGIGAALVKAAEEWARARGFELVRVRSNVARPGARGFYERLGFREIKTQAVFGKPVTGSGGRTRAGGRRVNDA